MCLLVFAWQAHPRYRLIFAGNRDEFHDRPAAPMHWWPQERRAEILAGQDLKAGGTWLGLARSTRFGVVTNYRDMQRPVPGAASRGELITQWLTSDESPSAFSASLSAHADNYAGFNLLVADESEMSYSANRTKPFASLVAPGIHGLSNHLLDTPWPKLERTRERFVGLAAQYDPSLDELERILADRAPAPDADLPTTGLPRDRERLLSAPFIVDPAYGTRCTTVVLVAHDGATTVRERRFDPMGRSTGMDEFTFDT